MPVTGRAGTDKRRSNQHKHVGFECRGNAQARNQNIKKQLVTTGMNNITSIISQLHFMPRGLVAIIRAYNGGYPTACSANGHANLITGVGGMWI